MRRGRRVEDLVEDRPQSTMSEVRTQSPKNHRCRQEEDQMPLKP